MANTKQIGKKTEILEPEKLPVATIPASNLPNDETIEWDEEEEGEEGESDTGGDGNNFIDADLLEQVAAPSPVTSQQISRNEIERIKQDRRLPPPPGKKPTLEETQTYLESLPEQAYNRLMIYMYRVTPIINRRMKDPKAVIYIDKLGKDAVDQGLRDYTLNIHGGGKYKLTINDTEKQSRPGEGTSTIMTVLFNIPIDEKMPILDYTELDLTAKENMGYIGLLKNQGILGNDGQIMTNTHAATAGDTEVTKMLLQMYEKLNTQQQQQLDKLLNRREEKPPVKEGGDTLANVLLEKLRQEDPNKQVATMVSLITAMQGMSNKGSDNSSAIITLMAESHKQQMEMMTKVVEMASKANTPPSTPQDGFLAGLLQFAKVREAVPELFGGTTQLAEKKGTAEIVLDGIKEIGLPAIGLISQFVQMRTGTAPIIPTNPQQAEAAIRGMGMAPGPQPGQQMTAIPAPQGNPANSANANPNVIPMSTTPANPVTSEYLQGTVLDVETNQPLLDESRLTTCQKFLIQYGGMLSTAINQPNTDGVTLAENLVAMSAMLGFDAYGILKAQGPDQILLAMKSIPDFWNVTGAKLGEPHIKVLIDEFLNYEEILRKEAEAEEAELETEVPGKGA